MKNMILAAAAVLALGAGIVGPVLAGHSGEHKEEIALLAGAALSLGEAAAKAEALHEGSRAVEAALDKDLSGKSIWEITVVTPDKIFDVILDGATGDVVSNQEDRD